MSNLNEKSVFKTISLVNQSVHFTWSENSKYLFCISWYSILFYYPTAENTVQITVQTNSDVCKVENAKLSHSLSFTDRFIDYSSWIINPLLDILVCTVVLLYIFTCLYFDSPYGLVGKEKDRGFNLRPKGVHYHKVFARWLDCRKNGLLV